LDSEKDLQDAEEEYLDALSEEESPPPG